MVFLERVVVSILLPDASNFTPVSRAPLPPPVSETQRIIFDSTAPSTMAVTFSPEEEMGLKDEDRPSSTTFRGENARFASRT